MNPVSHVSEVSDFLFITYRLSLCSPSHQQVSKEEREGIDIVAKPLTSLMSLTRDRQLILDTRATRVGLALQSRPYASSFQSLARRTVTADVIVNKSPQVADSLRIASMLKKQGLALCCSRAWEISVVRTMRGMQ